MKVAVLHDYFFQIGGAEHVALKISEIFNAPVYTTYMEKGINAPNVISVSNSRFLKTKGIGPSYAAWLFENLDVEEYDILISSGSWAKYVITTPNQRHIHYCHTPPRALYDTFHFTKNRLSGISKIAFKIWAYKMRKWDFIAAQRPDRILANSKNTQKRIEQYWRRSAEVLYPPVETDKFRNAKSHDSGYFFVISRLYPEKRVDLVVKAFKMLPEKRLIIAGTGPELERLKKIASPNIEFLGWVDEETKLSLYKGAEAFIFTAKDEDFGLTPIEAQASGTPVIGIAEGGVKETVIHGETGILISPDNEERLVSKLADVIGKFHKEKFLEERLIENARRFDIKVFRKKMIQIIKEEAEHLQQV